MKIKNFGLWLILIFVFPIVFSFVFFMSIQEMTTNTWISYISVIFSYILGISITVSVYNSTKDPVIKRVVPLICLVSFIAVFIYSLTFLSRQEQVTKEQLIAEIIIYGISVLLIVSALLFDRDTHDQLKAHKKEMAFINEGSLLLKNAISINTDIDIDNKIKKAYNLLHSSPSNSNEDVKNNEEEILFRSSELIGFLTDGNKDAANKSIDLIIAKINARNDQLKMK